MTPLAELLRHSLAGGSLAALPLALLGGVVAGLNPCCLPLYPAAAATCCATREEAPRLLGRRAAAFVLGVALATSLLGVVAAVAGRTLAGLGPWVTYPIAVAFLLIGVQLLGWLRLPRWRPALGLRPSGAVGAMLGGAVVSLVFAPCGTPVLASVLSYAAYQGSVSYGALLLFLYGLGVGGPILLIGSAAAGLAARLDGLGWRRWVDRASGLLFLGIGFYLVWQA
ncbi:MAG: cytochrome c biogenesis CcdA family protein [Deltaproteobacteria bacterium]